MQAVRGSFFIQLIIQHILTVSRKNHPKKRPFMHVERAIPSTDDLQLLGVRLKNEDREAFSHLFHLLRIPLMKYVWWIVRDEALTEDVVQEVFIKLWNVRSEINPEKSIRSLLYTIARNLALNAKRGLNQKTLRLDSVAQTLDQAPIPSERLQSDLLEQQMEAWIEALPERRREAFRLSRYAGLSHEEIATSMSLSPATVNRHIVLALQTLRELVIQHYPEWKNHL